MFPEAMKGMVCGEPSRVHPGGDCSIRATHSQQEESHTLSGKPHVLWGRGLDEGNTGGLPGKHLLKCETGQSDNLTPEHQELAILGFPGTGLAVPI